MDHRRARRDDPAAGARCRWNRDRLPRANGGPAREKPLTPATVHAAPSPLLVDQLDALREATRESFVADLACGRGRHALAVAAAGLRVVGIDRNRGFLDALGVEARERALAIERLHADLERSGLPLAPGRCGAVLVFRYLHRPLCPAIAGLLRLGGLLVYETFTIHQRDHGYGPSNPDFLLQPGELPRLFPDLEVLHVWEGVWNGTTPGERPAAVSQLVARRR